MYKFLEDLQAVLIGMTKGFILFFLSYRSVHICIFAAIVAGIIHIFASRKKKIEEWRWKINLEFREVMAAVSSSLRAGHSIENSFREVPRELRALYGDASVILPEIEKINNSLELNQSIEEVLKNFAEYTKVDDIRNFSSVFMIAKRSGGNLIEVAKTTSERIGDKIEVNREIRTMIAGKKLETDIMNLIPLGIIVYMWICSPGFLDCLYTGTGRLFMTVFLFVYCIARKWSEKIIDISV